MSICYKPYVFPNAMISTVLVYPRSSFVSVQIDLIERFIEARSFLHPDEPYESFVRLDTATHPDEFFKP